MNIFSNLETLNWLEQYSIDRAAHRLQYTTYSEEYEWKRFIRS